MLEQNRKPGEDPFEKIQKLDYRIKSLDNDISEENRINNKRQTKNHKSDILYTYKKPKFFSIFFGIIIDFFIIILVSYMMKLIYNQFFLSKLYIENINTYIIIAVGILYFGVIQGLLGSTIGNTIFNLRIMKRKVKDND